MMKSYLRIWAWLPVGLLAACSGSSEGLREDLGLMHRAPDEYTVYSRPPLSVPPDFNLRPPASGAQASADQSAAAQDDAHNKILSDGTSAPAQPANISAAAPASGPLSGTAPTAVPSVSAGELPGPSDSQFLSDAGATTANPHIREQIDRDNIDGVAPAASSASSGYLFTGKSDGDPVVDAAGEQARLKQDKAQNQPPTTGQTPSVQPSDRGILGDIF